MLIYSVVCQQWTWSIGKNKKRREGEREMVVTATCCNDQLRWWDKMGQTMCTAEEREIGCGWCKKRTYSIQRATSLLLSTVKKQKQHEFNTIWRTDVGELMHVHDALICVHNEPCSIVAASALLCRNQKTMARRLEEIGSSLLLLLLSMSSFCLVWFRRIIAERKQVWLHILCKYASRTSSMANLYSD